MLKFVNNVKRYGLASALVIGSSGAMAADVDTTGVLASLGTAESSAHLVAAFIIGIVAGLAAVGIILRLMGKL